MNDVTELVPRHKRDHERARAAVAAGFPAVEPILGDLLKWLRDYNWPVARMLLPLLTSIGEPLAPHVRDVLDGDDLIWKYWVIELISPSFPHDVAEQFRGELERLHRHPTQVERREELDQQAGDGLRHFGWLDGDT